MCVYVRYGGVRLFVCVRACMCWEKDEARVCVYMCLEVSCTLPRPCLLIRKQYDTSPTLAFFIHENESTTTRFILGTVSSNRDWSRRSQKFSSLAWVTLWLFFKGVDGQTTRRAASNGTTHSHNYGKTETRGAVKMRRYRRQRIMNCSADGALLDESKGFEVWESKEPGWKEMGYISFIFKFVWLPFNKG